MKLRQGGCLRVLFDGQNIGSVLRRRASTARDGIRSRLYGQPLPTILMYHRIAEEPFDPWGLAVTPAHFREQLAWLSQNRTVLRLQEFADLQRRRSLPRDAVAVTIDDGYSCVGDIAAPLLEQFGIPATIFVPVELIEKRKPFWWDELEEIVFRHAGSSLTVDGDVVPLGSPTSDDRRWEPRSEPRTARQSAFQDILGRVTRRKPAERDEIMNDLRRQAGPPEPQSSRRPMAPGQLRKIAGSVIEFGSHTRTHPWLTELDPDEQAEEIGGSIEALESLTGTRPTVFAYPYGTSDKRSQRLVEAAGFHCACVTGDRAVSHRTTSFALPRLRVGDWDAAGLEHALARVQPA